MECQTPILPAISQDRHFFLRWRLSFSAWAESKQLSGVISEQAGGGERHPHLWLVPFPQLQLNTVQLGLPECKQEQAGYSLCASSTTLEQKIQKNLVSAALTDVRFLAYMHQNGFLWMIPLLSIWWRASQPQQMGEESEIPWRCFWSERQTLRSNGGSWEWLALKRAITHLQTC